MADRPYKRLPGRSNGFLNIATLWEAEDHLLLVESNRVSESYRRFFYRDIQAIVICQTKTGLVTGIVLALVGAIFGAVAFVVGSEAGIVLGVLGGSFFLVALFYFLRGQTCRCTLRTAVQSQSLASLNRVNNARKVLLRIQPRIAAAQHLPPDQ